MAKKRTMVFTDVRPVSGKLDVNDALRLAVADQRFAKALMTAPDDFRDVFNLREIEVEAIKDSIGHLGAEADGYE